MLADLDRDGAPETVVLRQGSTEIVAWKALLERSYLPLVARNWHAPWPFALGNTPPDRAGPR